MRGPVGLEAASGLLELPFAAVPVVPLRVEPGHGDMDETLEEVTLRGGRLAPLVLELLVRLEVRTGANQLQPSLEAHRAIIGIRERC